MTDWQPEDGAVAHGGGVQTTALLVLAGQGLLQYKTFLFANVGDDSEDPHTLAYHREIAVPYAAAAGLDLHELHRVRRDKRVETLYGELTRPGSRRLPIPVRMDNGAPGTRSCTADFKIKVIGRWLRARGARGPVPARGKRPALDARPAVICMGISLDEIHRINARKVQPYERLAYPLVGVLDGQAHDFGLGAPMRRSDCERVILAEPLPGGPGGELAARLRAVIDDRDPATGEYRFAPVTRHDLKTRGFTVMPRPGKSSCWFCVAGETEVVTRQGIRPIAELAGESADLLIPKVGTRGGLDETGTWQTVEVRDFGVQPLRRITLTRGRSRKFVHATGEHRWMLKAGRQWADAATLVRTTDELRPGDRLKALRAAPLTCERISPFGVAHGFVYGDGDRPQGARGATLTLYDNGKDQALLPYFAGCEPKLGEDGNWFVYGLPRAWKRSPDLAEHRGYLLGWLAGYFAADGHVSKIGAATLYSTAESSIRAARDVCAVLGVGYSPIRSRLRRVALSGHVYDSVLYQLNIDRRTVPAGFFILAEHAKRAARNPTDSRQPAWTVEAVEETGRVERVYCAVVPGAQAFALADELMTGNCPLHRMSAWQVQREERPATFARACALEAHLQEQRAGLGRDPVYLTRFAVPLARAVPEGQLQLLSGDGSGDDCDNGWCMT